MNYLKVAIKLLLFAAAAAPLFVFSGLSFPFMWSKALVFRVVVEIALLLACIMIITSKGSIVSRDWIRKFIRHPLVLATSAFLVSAIISTLTAHNTFRAFWGYVDRSDGLVSLFHYAAFTVLAVIFFGDKDWRIFFRCMVGAGFIMMFYALLQYMSVTKFPFALNATIQPGSFLENPAFFSQYLLLLLGPVAVLYMSSGKRGFGRYAALLTALLALFLMFVTNVRGEIIGLFIGAVTTVILLLIYGLPKFKKYGIALLALAVLGSGLFLATRSSPFWQKIPGVNRIAKISADDFSVKTRLIALGVSWEAFKEKPLFGWGLENYNVAYNTHYNPEYAAYEEAWFDRAHNKVAEVAVMQGLVGLIAYLGIFGAVFTLLIRGRPKFDATRPERATGENAAKVDIHAPSISLSYLLFGVLVAYFIQNLFLFDTPVSLLLFFAILAFVIGKTIDIQFSWVKRKAPHVSSPRVKPGSTTPSFIPIVFSTIGIFLAFYLLYGYNFIPFRQSATFWKVFATKKGNEILTASTDFLRPYNFLQPTLRSQFLEQITLGDALHIRSFDPVTTLSIEAMEEVGRREPTYDPRTFIRLAEAYNEKGKDFPELLPKAEAHLRHALTLSPKRQDLYYLLAYNLAGQDRFDESIAIMREVVASNPRVGRAHYNLGIQLALAGSAYWDEAVEELSAAREIGFLNLPSQTTDFNNISSIYQRMLSIYVRNRDAERIIRIAEEFSKWRDAFLDISLRTSDPQIAEEFKTRGDNLKHDMDIIIDFVKRGDWETLINEANRQWFDAYAKLLVRYARERNKGEVLRVVLEMKSVTNDEDIKKDLDVIADLAEKSQWDVLAEFLGVAPPAFNIPPEE